VALSLVVITENRQKF